MGRRVIGAIALSQAAAQIQAKLAASAPLRHALAHAYALGYLVSGVAALLALTALGRRHDRRSSLD
jgi:hypothetical protein